MSIFFIFKFVEIFGKVKNHKSRSPKFFCWVFENDFEYFFSFFEWKMANLKKSPYGSEFCCFKNLATDLKLQMCFKKNFKEAKDKSHFYFRETSPFNRFKMQIDIHWNWHRLATQAIKNILSKKIIFLTQGWPQGENNFLKK